YNGVFLRQWDSVREKNVMTFSVLNGSGEAVWGVN
ncbi:lipocalin-like domain-containing protein, partial [Bacillus subtilis]